MTNEPRKASDILLSLESQMQQLIAIYRNQDLVLKVLANKLNSLIETVNILATSSATPLTNSQQSPSEIYNPYPAPTTVNIVGEFKLPVEAAPQGFRRTSRPETYDTNTNQPQASLKKVNVTPPPITSTVVASNPEPINLPLQFPDFDEVHQPQPLIIPKQENKKSTQNSSENKIPVQQRIVDKNGKAIFLANIEIINTTTGDSEFKCRTNGIGKWQASLKPGAYKVKVDKQESLSKGKIELIQDITIDGLSQTQELPVLICR